MAIQAFEIRLTELQHERHLQSKYHRVLVISYAGGMASVSSLGLQSKVNSPKHMPVADLSCSCPESQKHQNQRPQDGSMKYLKDSCLGHLLCFSCKIVQGVKLQSAACGQH